MDRATRKLIPVCYGRRVHPYRGASIVPKTPMTQMFPEYSPVHVLPDSNKHYNPEGEFVHWGWLSVPEINQGLRNLGLETKVSVKVCEGLCDLPHIPNGKSVIMLVRKHYICVTHTQCKLLFFDPLNQPVQLYFGRELKQLTPIGCHVQPVDSAYCGNFNLFFLHMLYRHVPISKFTKNNIADGVRKYLQEFFYVSPQDISSNTMIVEFFTVDYQLGEEFNNLQKYKKFSKYEKHLSSKTLGIH
ncbi:MAG: LO8 [Arowana adomavirus]|uniref:LO8 n=1 Tax=Arowana adomavirus TaxID=2219223 RepID=A0A2U9Q1S7_9VIRU|nr:MAG: LO8 [Arowana adomavirus]